MLDNKKILSFNKLSSNMPQKLDKGIMFFSRNGITSS